MPITGNMLRQTATAAKAERPIAHTCDLVITGKRPIIVLLPGIQGSHLVDHMGKHWLSFHTVAQRNMSKIGALDHFKSNGILQNRYGQLASHLRHSFDVVEFHYDWRKSIQDQAHRLDQLVRDILNKTHGTTLPVHFLGHSMGGLLARMFMTTHKPTWLRVLAQNENSKLLMLGSPNGGSAAIVASLIGQDPIIRLMQKLDQRRPDAAILNDMARMPGLLELLPMTQSGKFFDRSFWQQLCDAAPEGWNGPSQRDLTKAKSTHSLLRNAADVRHITYIAGQSAATLINIDVDPHQGRPVLHTVSTNAGDGRVSWRGGQMLGVPTWYAQGVQHRDLPKQPAVFLAIAEILTDGSTDLLPQSAPICRAEARLQIHKKPLRTRKIREQIGLRLPLPGWLTTPPQKGSLI